MNDDKEVANFMEQIASRAKVKGARAKTKIAKPTKAWCVKSRRDNLILEFLRIDKVVTIKELIKKSKLGCTWTELQKQGYRCVRVEIREVKDA